MNMNRREFIKTQTAAACATAAGAAIPGVATAWQGESNKDVPMPGDPMDLGAVRRAKIRCVSETGWFDTPTLLADLKATNEDLTQLNQYDLAWPPYGDLHRDNAGGSSALIEIEDGEGKTRKFLFDSGWNREWMDQRFAEEGIDRMLQSGEIEFIVISHEHFDHFWGIGSAIGHRPDIPLYIPDSFHPEAFTLLKKVGHTGPIHQVPLGEPALPFPGLAIAHFPMETLGNVQGENVVYMNLTDKGLAMVTGCGHGGVLQLLDYGQRTFRDARGIHAVYGGLHISPFGKWDDEMEKTVQALGKYGIKRLGCNHCTGERTVQRMIELGMPVVRGTARHGSKSDLYLGNGDVFEVG
uniref:7,8-dihydropterin-6-yl-methyl-4-(Beta-D-ribofuranosyl)aminobenzene 5'-phosphate synthase n=1 Tax=Candidatus Kentrum sp. DK TaxID=2126562 RepID=A0A450TFE0_9GAMM|nr:MAG: 7,8-dihydropterin-6-yl-methyl-4-(beta-D-ribofuranosyl)aminobenzene 5'-phosphate synthase [Candidatus Kentron sp. DK]